MITVPSSIWKTENNLSLTETLKSLEAKCRSCTPITPMECINSCRVYKIKNELRHLWETIDNPNYIKELYNVLKNPTRLQIMQAILKCPCSLSRLQHELKKAGHSHSQDNINREYLRPLMAVGLATVSREEYSATSFSRRMTELLGCLLELADKLPARTECYEESLLQSLLSGPKTFEDIKTFVPPKAVSRILQRLRSTCLIETPKDRSYIFFFRSKRDSNKEKLTVTQRRIYDAVADGGSPVGKIAKDTGLSIRRTYKYLRSLKGKKLIFTRRTPKVYGLTCNGEKLASAFRDLQKIVEVTWNSSQQVMQESEVKAGGLTRNAFR